MSDIVLDSFLVLHTTPRTCKVLPGAKQGQGMVDDGWCKFLSIQAWFRLQATIPGLGIKTQIDTCTTFHTGHVHANPMKCIEMWEQMVQKPAPVGQFGAASLVEMSLGTRTEKTCSRETRETATLTRLMPGSKSGTTPSCTSCRRCKQCTLKWLHANCKLVQKGLWS